MGWLKAAISTALMVGCAAAAHADTKITIGYSGASEFLPAFVAYETGLFRKHGLDVRLTGIALSSTIPAALLSETLDIGITSPTAILVANEGGLDMVSICASNRLRADNPRIGLVTRSGYNVMTAPDVIGHKIGIPGFYSSIEVMFRKWAFDRGVRPDQLTLVEVALPQMADVLRGGSVDGVTAIEPVISRILTNVPGTKTFDYVAQLTNDTVGAMWMATRPWIAAHPEAAKQFVLAYQDAIAAIGEDPDAAHKIEAKYVGYVGRSFPSFSTKLTVADMEFFQSMMLQLDLLKERQDVSRMIMQ